MDENLLKEFIVFGGVFLAVGFVLLIARRVALAAVHRWAARTAIVFNE